MTLDQLKTLQAIVEGGSLKEAAALLHKTQPTISVAIRNLESELGVNIFARDQYRNRLTAEGEALYERAKLVLSEASTFTALGKRLAAGEESEVGIAFDSAIPVHLILQVVKQCKAEFPTTRLTMFSENNLGSLDRIKTGQAAMAIMPWVTPSTGMESLLFLNLTMQTVVSGDSHLLDKYKIVPKQVMKGYSQVVINDSSRNPSNKKYGVLEGGDQWKVNDYQTKKQIILQDMGWGSLPEHFMADELKQGLLVPIEVQGLKPVVDIPIHVVRQVNEAGGPVAQRLWQLFNDIN